MSQETSGKMLVLGLMSGTSLDGLDLALCEFDKTPQQFDYQIISAKTIGYTKDWINKLTKAKDLSAEKYFELHAAFGRFLGEEIKAFLTPLAQKPMAIASHGHTVFHQPAKGFSTQLGCGASIAAVAGITTIYDFRSLDVALNGQGAPLVPIGDELLFSRYHSCLNIGGIANISHHNKAGKRVAYDICVANMVLNYLAEKLGSSYDKNGTFAREGNVDEELLKKLNGLEFYSQRGAKSIGREWFEKNILPLIADRTDHKNLLSTFTEHLAVIIAQTLNSNNLKNVLMTGGGTHNTFLIERIKAHTKCELVIPEKEIIDFKEALIFAFLGYLRINQSTNTLASVTGATTDSVGGSVVFMR